MNVTDEQLRRYQQAERVLSCIVRALGHDLPNYFVALQGLVRLLDMEEADRLGPDGREYLERLGAATQRAQELVESLRVLGKVGQEQQPCEDVPLAELARE